MSEPERASKIRLVTESRYSEARIRGEPDARSLAGVDRRAEEGLDPTVPARPVRERGEVRVPDPSRTARAVERVLRSKGGDVVPGAPPARGARFREEPVAGAGDRNASKVLPAHGPRSDRVGGSPRDLGRDDGRRGTRPGGRSMTPPDEYLEQVRRAMSGMEPRVRDDILLELRSHITESTAANGGNVNASLAAVGSAEDVGHHYRELYGYGRSYKILFAAIAFFAAFPSVPVLAVGTESLFPYVLSVLFLVIAAVWILWVSVAAGSRVGILAGVTAMISRFAAFGIAAVTLAGAETTATGLGLLIGVSLMLVLLGWIPGTAKKAWSAPRAQL